MKRQVIDLFLNLFLSLVLIQFSNYDIKYIVFSLNLISVDFYLKIEMEKVMLFCKFFMLLRNYFFRNINVEFIEFFIQYVLGLKSGIFV